MEMVEALRAHAANTREAGHNLSREDLADLLDHAADVIERQQEELDAWRKSAPAHIVTMDEKRGKDH